jgi:sugar transferase EpsL
MKRIFDLLVTLIFLPVWLTVLIVTMLLVWVILGRPILFRQERGGYLGRPFMLWKLRTMNNHTDSTGKLLPDADRLTRFGSFLRSTSLDELPCFINVLMGDMSLVGPRPFISRYLPLYTPSQMLRHSVKPGITGWAQVKGRNSLSWEEKFELDLWYVNNRSTYVDLKIIILTVGAIFRRDGINSNSTTTMSEFFGTKN